MRTQSRNSTHKSRNWKEENMTAEEVVWEFYFDEVHERNRKDYDPYWYIHDNDMTDRPTEEELSGFYWKEE
tara:strand:+ start:1641 stop:1853 length:213 start_codon:yes stop_codon:yes gene_type:complete